MSLRPSELTLLAAEATREVSGAAVQKVHAPTTTRVYLELRVPGRSVTLLLCSDAGAARLSAVDERPPNPATPPGWQSVLRRELVGARLADAEALPARRTLLLHFTREARRLTLALEVGPSPALLLLTKDARVLAQSTPGREGLRMGGTWTPLPEAPLKDAPSRLASDVAFLRLLHGAETLLAASERARWTDERRRPLLAKLKRLSRTREKVQADLERTGRAQALKEEGELLKQHLPLLQRGLPSVTVTEYPPDGEPRPRTIALDPRRTPKEEVAFRFHQYKRLSRGAGLAHERLAQLDAEARALEQALAALESAPAELPAPQRAKAKAAAQGRLPPYREYRGHGGHRIWVGRGAARNDELTFHVARPHHLWLHARGVPGAHVVVPLDKGAVASGELLVDAAHLALFHSDAKGEPRGEVSAVPVKFVRKVKGAAPGAVTYSQEKTFVCRVEAERLARLLATADAES